jgi:hypothetical protein
MKLYKSTEGYEYTEDEVLTAAKESNMSIDDYIVEFDMTPAEEGEPGKKKPVAGKGAAATGKTKGTASKPATTSSGSKKVNPWETAEQAKKREATFGVGAIVKTPKQAKPVAVKQEVVVPQVDPLDEEIDLSGFKPEDFYTPDQIQKDPTIQAKFSTKLTNTKNKFDYVKEVVKAQKAGAPIKSLPGAQLIGLTPEETKAKTNDYATKINLEMADETDPLNEDNYDPKATLANQSVNYKKKAQDVINATGDYAWMETYSKDDRVEYVQNNLAAPRLAYKVWNSDKNDFDIVAKKGYVNELKKLLPKNFAEIKDAKQLNRAIDVAITQYAAKDPSLQFQKELAIDKAKPLLSDKVKELQRKYNTATPEGLAKAEAEYNVFATKIITDNLNSSSAARDLEADFNAVAQTAATEVNTAFERSEDTFLSTMDKIATKGANPLLSIALEGMGKGLYGMGLSGRQMAVSSMHGRVSELNTFSKKALEGHADNEKYDRTDEWPKMAMLESFTNKGDYMGPPKTYGEAKRRIKAIVDKVNVGVSDQVDKIVESGKYLELFKKADLKNGVQFTDIVSLVSENVPNMVVAGAGAMTGNPLLIGLGAASAFTQEYGNQYYDAIITGLKRDLNREPTKEEIAEAINNGEYADKAEATAWAAVSAGLEFASELNVVKKTAKAMGLGSDANKALGSLMRGEIKAFGKSMYQQGKDFTSSGLGEFLTEGIQTGIGQASKGTQLNEGITKYLDVNQMLEDAQAGGIVGTVLPFGGTVMRQSTIELRNSARQIATTFNLDGRMGSFKEANAFFKAAEQNINNRFTAGDINEKEKNAELEALTNIRNTGLKLPSTFSKEGKQVAFDLLVEKNQLETEIQGKDPALVAPQKERLKGIDGQLTAISIVESQKNKDAENMNALDRNIKAIEGYANTLGQTEFENAVGEGKGVESFETVADFKAALENTGNYSESEINEAMESDGFMLKNGQIVINKQIAAQRNLHTMGHELLHKILKSEFSDPVRGKELKDKFLAQLSPEERKLLDERILAVDENTVVEELRKELGREPNETEIKQAISEGKGRLYSDEYLEEAPDEYLTQYFQIVADKKIPWSEKLGDSLEKLWKNFLGLFFTQKGYDKLEFADGKDIYRFINDYAKSIKSGKISQRAQDLTKAGTNIKKAVDAPSKSNLQGLLTDKYGGNKRRFISEGLMTTPKGKETFDFTKSVIGEEVGGLVETITRRLYDGIPADSKKTVSREDYKTALISAAATLIDREWDPSKQDLDKFVSNRLNLRANSLAKELGIEGITEGGIKADVDQAKSLMTEETKQEVKEKPKYKTILESKVFKEEVVNSVKDKLVRELRTLKSKIDEAVSINKTTTPLIAEIKDAMGKQADIDIKKALGGKPNNEFRSNILKNKKAILENMTTTWLMGKATKKGVEGGIPAAIQKQVDGKFLSYPDWVGKKIDREKVTTNLAGKTSGADIVRRLPNAVNNVSDADFLSSFLEPNGDLIRGRKESLSKAMAEELSFDIFKQGLEEGGPIAEAFERNQELKDVVLLDNYVNEVARQLDRGTAKFSKTLSVGDRKIIVPDEYLTTEGATSRFINNVGELIKDIADTDIDEVFDFETNELLQPFSEKYDEFVGEFVAALYETGRIESKAGVQFKQAIYKNENIPAEVRAAFKKVGNLRYNKEALDDLNQAAKEVAKRLDPSVLKAIGYDWLGYTHRVMNSAKERKDGTPGEFYEELNSLKEIIGEGALPNGLNIADIRLMNKAFPLFKKVQKILNKDITKEEKLEQLKELQPEIEAANAANIQLAVHLGTVIGNLLKEGKISSIAALNLAQIQTGIVAGWRGLSRLDLITVKDGSQKAIKGDDSTRSKGEHLAPNSNTMLKMVDVWFNAAKDNSINIEKELNEVFSEHSQWLTNVAITKVIDKKGGTNNPTNFHRVKFASKEDQADVYGVDGQSYMQVLAKMEAMMAVNKAFNEFKVAIEPEIQKDKTFDKAMANASKFSKTPKKIRVFDFDDTLAQTKSNVLYTMPGDPKQYKIDAATFAKEGKFLEDAGAKWDFSEFSKVMNGKKGPLFEVAKIIADKKGTNDVFVLTARPANSAGPIQEFLKSLGLDIPVKNITGLGNSSPQAKADWIVGKAAEGYNDFYFADDHTGNVKAVKDALSVLDVKGKVQQAKIKNELFSPAQIDALQKEIESNYNAELKLGNENNDIRTSLFNYDDPIAQKTSNGVDLRITEGLIRDQKKTYLLYADGKPVAEFKSVDDAKNTVKFIEDNLIKPQVLQNGGAKFSKSIDQQFNEIIETNKGIGAQKRYSGITSKRLGASKGNYKFFLPPGAEDFEGLLYNFLGKGKEGEAQAEFFERTLLAPYWEGVSAIESARQKIKRDFKALKKAFPDAADKITKKTPDGNFTYDQAIRVYLWTKEGKAIPELSRGDQARLNSLVANDPQLAAFANGLELVSGRTGGWSDPSEFWDSDTIVSELNDMTEKVGRKTYLEEFIKNADEIFSNDNMNKIEAIYGTNIREALEGALYRMKNGKNQSMGSGKATAAVNAWVNGSVAEIMFLNTKSGVLQLISSLNYLNLRDNNPIMAGKALLNFPQFAKDFATIFNSDMMKERRQGLKEDVSAAEIANAAATSKNKVKAMSAYLAKIGFTPTTIADALAIGMGGASFYRNRINTYEKQGMSKAEAEARAWKDFTKLTNKSAQSNDPALISQQQAEPIGRIILAFGNATMQMNRIMKKSARDLINGRGNPIDHISRILFYGFIQNAIFSALQKAVFIGLFGDDDEEKDKDKKKQKTTEEKAIELADDMLDSFLRGSGLAGAVVSTAKNTAQEYFKQRAKKAKGDQAYTLLAGLNISPSIGSKARKIYGAIQEEKFNRAVIERMGGKVMLDGRLNPSPIYNVGAKLVAAGTNLPADRLLDKITNISEALDARNENWQRAMLMLGYKPFELGVKNEEQEAIKAQAKLEREDEVFIEGIEKKKAKIKKLRSMTQEERQAYTDSIKATIPAKIERTKRRRKLLYGK